MRCAIAAATCIVVAVVFVPRQELNEGRHTPAASAAWAEMLAFLRSRLLALRQKPADVLMGSTLTAEQRVRGLSTLWAEARNGFAYFDRVSEKWDLTYEQFIPRVLAATSDYQYYSELMRFFAHLEDGHSGVFWPSAFDDALGYPPLEIAKLTAAR